MGVAAGELGRDVGRLGRRGLDVVLIFRADAVAGTGVSSCHTETPVNWCWGTGEGTHRSEPCMWQSVRAVTSDSCLLAGGPVGGAVGLGGATPAAARLAHDARAKMLLAYMVTRRRGRCW